MKLTYILPPPKISYIQRHFKKSSKISILDVGCGNDSPSLFKYWYPESTYHGLDIARYNLTDKDEQMMDKFIVVKPCTSYNKVLFEKYDVIVMNHVIEHMKDSSERISELCNLLNPCGILYIAFPSVRSLSLQPAIGTLNFCDDPTHVYIPCIREISNILLANGVKVIYAGESKDTFRYIIGFFLNIFETIRRVLIKKFRARGLWFYYGFESSVIGIKK